MELRPDVVAGKYDPSLFDPTGVTLLVNEIFYSVQGEGANTGVPTVFIRLAKCNLACKFCDTEFETFEKMSCLKVVEKARHLVDGNAEHVMVDITGGEPLLQQCEPLIRNMKHFGFTNFGAETSGSVSANWLDQLNWLTVSPKVPKARIPQQIVDRASEYKWIVNAAFLKQFEENPDNFYIPKKPNFLQPESCLEKWTTAATKLVLAHPDRYMLSLQTHKFAKNP